MIKIYIMINKVLNIIKPIEYAFFKNKNGINTKIEREKKIIISLTSIPSRYSKLSLCIEGLLRQRMKPDKIILYLGIENKNIKLPKKVLNQTKRGLTIEYREDLKPHTKYFYAIDEYPNDIIITVDDDIFYSKKLVETLYKSYLKYPRCVSCMRSHKILFDGNKIKPYNEWIYEYNGKDATTPSHLFFATGVGGVLYPPKVLPKEIFEISKLKELSYRQDDVWLKAMEILNNTKVVKASNKDYHLYIVRGTQQIALNKSNVGKCQNDIYINNVLTYYNLKKQNFYE